MSTPSTTPDHGERLAARSCPLRVGPLALSVPAIALASCAAVGGARPVNADASVLPGTQDSVDTEPVGTGSLDTGTSIDVVDPDRYAPVHGDSVIALGVGTSLGSADSRLTFNDGSVDSLDVDDTQLTLDLTYSFFVTDAIEVGVQGSHIFNNSETRLNSPSMPQLNSSSEETGTITTVAVLANYNYAINPRSLLFIGPQVGVARQNIERTDTNTMGSLTSQVSDTSFYWGFQLGYRQFLTPTIGYRVELSNRFFEFEDGGLATDIAQSNLMIGLDFAF